MNPTNAIVQLNKYDREKYNVLVPVTTMQVASNLQRITVSEVQLDVRQNSSNNGPSKDIYYEKSSSAYAITKVGGMKLAAAANISIVSTTPGRTEACDRCIEMARATGKARSCGNCPHVHDVAVTVTIRVPEPSGGFRLLQATKEIDCTLEAAGMKDGANGQQYRRFLPHRTAMAESKAFMRAIRAALGLAGTYAYEDLKKPFVVARVVPNLDAPCSLWGCSLKRPSPQHSGRRSKPRSSRKKRNRFRPTPTKGPASMTPQKTPTSPKAANGATKARQAALGANRRARKKTSARTATGKSSLPRGRTGR